MANKGGPLKVMSPKPSFQSNRPVLVATAPIKMEAIGNMAITSATLRKVWVVLRLGFIGPVLLNRPF
jgi:hypothetical protein